MLKNSSVIKDLPLASRIWMVASVTTVSWPSAMEFFICSLVEYPTGQRSAHLKIPCMLSNMFGIISNDTLGLPSSLSTSYTTMRFPGISFRDSEDGDWCSVSMIDPSREGKYACVHRKPHDVGRCNEDVMVHCSWSSSPIDGFVPGVAVIFISTSETIKMDEIISIFFLESDLFGWLTHYGAVVLYFCSDCPSCPAHLSSINWET